MTRYSLTQLANLIDHTNLHPEATGEDITTLCQEACDHGFKMVAINQVQTTLCHQLLKETPVHVGAAISFPLGQTSIATKVFETKDALVQGADEIDYVVNLTKVKEHDWSYVEEEMRALVTLCRQEGALIKVIFENGYLTEEEKIALCQIAKKVQPDFIKTATGFGPSGATLADVRLMKEAVGSTVQVKAAGRIRTAEAFKQFVAAGATRIGTSSGITIMQELAAEATDGYVEI